MAHGSDTGGKKARRPVRKLIRWVFRIVVSLAILVLLFLHLLPYVTDTGVVRRLVARRLSERLRGSAVEIETLRVAPLSTHLLALEGFSLAPPAQADVPLVTIGRVDCHWRPRGLFDRRFHVTSARAGAVRVRISRQDGRWNFASILAEEPLRLEDLRLPLGVQIDSARVDGLDVEFAMQPGLTAAVLGISARLSCGLEGLLQGTAGVRATAQSVQVRLPFVHLALAQGPEVLLHAANRDGTVKLSGAVVADQLQVALDGLGALRPLDVGAGFEAEVDLEPVAVPRVEVSLQVPHLVSDILTASLTAGPDYVLRGENAFALDLGRAFGVAAHTGVTDVSDKASLGGKLWASTEFSARLSVGSGPVVYADVANRVLASQVAAAGEMLLPSAGRRETALTVELDGLELLLVQDVAVTVDDGIGGWSATDVACGLSELGADLGRIEFSAADVTARAQVGVSLPTAAVVDVSGNAGAGALRLADAELGQWTVPVHLDFRASARDVLDPARSVLTLEEAAGSVGGLVPEFRCTASVAGLGRDGLEVSGGGALDVTQAAGLLDGLTDDLRSTLGDVSASGEIEAGFRASGRLFGDAAGLELACVGGARLAGLDARRGAFSAGLDWLRSVFSLSVATDAQFLPHDVDAALTAAVGGLRAAMLADDPGGAPLLAATIERVDADASGRIPGPGLARVRSGGRLAVRELRPSLRMGAGGDLRSWDPVSVELAGDLQADPLAGDVILTDARLHVPGLADVAIPELTVEGFGGDSVTGDVRITLADIGGLARLALSGLPPSAAGRAFPSMAGKAVVRAGFTGRLPLVEGIVGAMESGQPLPPLEVFPLGRFYERDAPMNLDATFSVEDVEVSHVPAEGVEAGISGLAGEAVVSLEGGLLIGSGEVRLPSVRLGSVPVPLEDFRLSADFGMRDFDEVSVRDLRFSGLAGAVELGGEAAASGLGRLTAVPSPGDLLEKLDLDVRSSGVVRLGALAASEALESSGEANWDCALTLDGGRAAHLRIVPGLTDVSVRFRDLFALEGANGRLDFSKTWQIVRAPTPGAGADALSRAVLARPPAGGGPGHGPALLGFGTAADELLAPGGRLTVESVSALGGELIRAAALDLTAAGMTLSVPRFYLHPLGGKVLGTAFFRPGGQGRTLSMQGDFDGIDFRRMLPPEFRDFPGDSQIGGNFELSVLIGGEPGQDGSPNPLRDIAARLDVTHIGSAALDRLLLALDPQAAKPSFVGLRKALALGSPRRARASLRRGFVAMDVEVQGLAGRLVSEYSIPPFSISGLLGAEPVVRVLGKAGPAIAALNVLDAVQIELTPEGSVRFRQ